MTVRGWACATLAVRASVQRQAGESSERARRHAGSVSGRHWGRSRIVYCADSARSLAAGLSRPAASRPLGVRSAIRDAGRVAAPARGRLDQRSRMELDRRTFLILPAAAALTGALQPDCRRVDRRDAADRVGCHRRRAPARHPPHRAAEHDRARPGRARRGGLGRLLGEPEGRRRAGQRHRHPRLLPDQGAVPPQGQVPRHARLLRRLLRRREEARPEGHRAHEPGPELGGRDAGPSRMVPARRAGSDRRPHRGRAAVPHLHVLDLHDRLRAGGDEGGARAVRRRRRLHQRLAAARLDPALRLRCAAGRCRRTARWSTGRPSTGARSSCGASTTGSPRRRSRRCSTSGTSAAACARPPTWCRSASSPTGSSATTRAAAATTRRSGAARCRAASAAPCSRTRWPPTSPARGRPARHAGATSTRRSPKRACG